MRRAGAVAALIMALVSMTAGTAGAGTPPPGFYGVVSQGHLERDDMKRMGAGRVGTLRVSLPWGQIDRAPLPGGYDWSSFDQIVASAARERITILPTVYTVPQWVSALEGCTSPPGGPCTITPPHTQIGLAAWRTFLGAAVTRYGPGGLFWTLHPDLPAAPIRAWQIWNEENSPGFFAPRPDVGRYADLLRSAADAIRSQDPGAEIVLGGMFRYPLGGGKGGIRATDFLRGLYSQPGLEAAFDGVAVHPYAGRISGVERQVRRMAGVVRAAGDAQASLWITEIGWSSGGKRTPLNRGPRGQAQRLRAALGWFTRRRAHLRLRTVLWYAWRDVPESQSRCKWCARSGLFPVGSLDRPKPAWSAYVGFTGGT